MSIRIIRHNFNQTNFNNLRGSGLYYRGTICTSDSYKSYSNQVPTSPVPTTIFRSAPEPLCAEKIESSSNRWDLNNTVYNTFNSLWVNIPKKQFTRLKINGRGC